MRKIYLCKLCLIVSGALLAVQGAHKFGAIYLEVVTHER